MQKSSTTFVYHSETRELVKFAQGEMAYWVVYTYGINGRGVKLFEFTDARYTPTQAEHMAKHMVRQYNAGVDAGRTQIRNELYKVING